MYDTLHDCIRVHITNRLHKERQNKINKKHSKRWSIIALVKMSANDRCQKVSDSGLGLEKGWETASVITDAFKRERERTPEHRFTKVSICYCQYETSPWSSWSGVNEVEWRVASRLSISSPWVSSERMDGGSGRAVRQNAQRGCFLDLYHVFQLRSFTWM